MLEIRFAWRRRKLNMLSPQSHATDISVATLRPSTLVTVYTDEEILVGQLVGPLPYPTTPFAQVPAFSLRDVLASTLNGSRVAARPARAIAPSQIAAFSIHELLPAAGSSRRHRITLRTGPYYVQGFVDAPPALDLIASLRHRSRIDLTAAVVEYSVAGRLQRDLVPAISVNRLRVESIAEAWEPEVSARPMR